MQLSAPNHAVVAQILPLKVLIEAVQDRDVEREGRAGGGLRVPELVFFAKGEAPLNANIMLLTILF